MQHLIGYPTNSSYLCGQDAIGRRNIRTDTDPTLTTCKECKASPHFNPLAAEREAATATSFTQTNGRFTFTPTPAS